MTGSHSTTTRPRSTHSGWGRPDRNARRPDILPAPVRRARRRATHLDPVRQARQQNITIGASFGEERELSFLHAGTGALTYFPQARRRGVDTPPPSHASAPTPQRRRPQANGMLFAFGRDVNIRWKHGINAVQPSLLPRHVFDMCIFATCHARLQVPPAKQKGGGRISIVLWGWSTIAEDEDGSPPMIVNSFPDERHNKGGARSICRDFARGKCAYGKRCKFAHDDGGAKEKENDRPAPSADERR